MTTRIVSDTILDGSGDPMADALVTFYRRGGTFAPGASLPPATVTATTDDDGYYEATLTPNTEALTPNSWLAVYPNGESFEFVLFPGAQISVPEIRIAGMIVSWATPDLTVAMEAYRTTWDAALAAGIAPIAAAAGGYTTLPLRLAGIDSFPGAARLGAALPAGATSISLRTALSPFGAYDGYCIVDPWSVNAEFFPVRANPSGTAITVPSAVTYTPSTTHSLTDADGLTFAGATLSDADNGLGVFSPGEVLTVDDSDSNDGTYLIISVAGDGSSLTISTTFVSESPAVGKEIDLSSVEYRTSFDGDTNRIIDASRTGQGYGGFWRFMLGETVVVSGSAANNGAYLITDIPEDGTWIEVDGPLVDEGAGIAVTLRANIRFDHAADAAVLFVPAGDVNVRWFGANSDGLEASAATNTLAFNRCIKTAARWGLSRVLVPAGTYIVDNEIFLEREIHLCGDDCVNTTIKASVNFDFHVDDVEANHNTAVIHQMISGAKCWYESPYEGLASEMGRIHLHDIRIHGGSTRVVDDNPDIPVVITNPGANGILCSLQQPAEWSNVRVDNCDGYGICIAVAQQCIFRQLELIRCGTALLLRSAEFCWFYDTQIEQSTHVDGTAGRHIQIEDVPGNIDCFNVSFINVHLETVTGTGTPLMINIENGMNISFLNVWATVPANTTLFRFNYGASDAVAGDAGAPIEGGIVYTLSHVAVHGSPASCTIIRDIQRGLTLNAETDFKSFLYWFAAPTAQIDAKNGIRVAGIRGRMTQVLAPNEPLTPNFDAQAQATTSTGLTLSNVPLYRGKNGAGTTTFLVDGEGDTGVHDLAVSGAGAYTGVQTFSGGVKGGGSAPTIVADVAAGTSPTITISGTNMSGQITVTAGTSPQANNDILQLVFAGGGLSSTPRPQITPVNGNALSLGLTAEVGATTLLSTSFKLSIRGAALVAGTQYIWSYTAFQ